LLDLAVDEPQARMRSIKPSRVIPRSSVLPGYSAEGSAAGESGVCTVAVILVAEISEV
jgi:hypothetical protein